MNSQRNFVVGPDDAPVMLNNVDVTNLNKESVFVESFLSFQKTGDIRIKNVDVDTFLKIHKFVNDPDKFVARKLRIAELIETAIVADYFLVESLLTKAKTALRTRIRVGNVWSVLNQINGYSRIVDVCDKTLSEKSDLCIRDFYLKEASLGSWLYFLQLPYMNVTQEVLLVKATLTLSRHNNFDKSWLSASLPYLRLLSIDSDKNKLSELLMLYGKSISKKARDALLEKIAEGKIDDGPWKSIFQPPKFCPIQEKRVPLSGIISFQNGNAEKSLCGEGSFLFGTISAIEISGLRVSLPCKFSCDCDFNKKHKRDCLVQNYFQQVVEIDQQIFLAEESTFSKVLLLNGHDFFVLKSVRNEAYIKLRSTLNVAANSLLRMTFVCDGNSREMMGPTFNANKLHPLKHLPEPSHSDYIKNTSIMGIGNFLRSDVRLNGICYKVYRGSVDK